MKIIIGLYIFSSLSMQVTYAKFIYNGNGDMIQDNNGNTYAYNAESQLIKFAPVSLKNQVDINHYNAMGQRDGRKLDSYQLGMIYSNQHIINAIESKEHIYTTYLFNNARYINQFGQKETVQYMTGDNKNTTNILLASDSNLQNIYNYSAYGNNLIFEPNKNTQTTLANPIMDNPITYDGEYQDNDSGLIYLRARFYNPTIQNFMQRDDYHLMNRYNAFDGNPINTVDPNGHFPLATGMLGLATLSPLVDIGYNLYQAISGQEKWESSQFYSSMILDGIGLLISGTVDYLNYTREIYLGGGTFGKAYKYKPLFSSEYRVMKYTNYEQGEAMQDAARSAKLWNQSMNTLEFSEYATAYSKGDTLNTPFIAGESDLSISPQEKTFAIECAQQKLSQKSGRFILDSAPQNFKYIAKDGELNAVPIDFDQSMQLPKSGGKLSAISQFYKKDYTLTHRYKLYFTQIETNTGVNQSYTKLLLKNFIS